MKEKDITPKVIELSKEIAEHWKREPYIGCWGSDERESLYLITQNRSKWFFGEFPIPSISDCLEKLRELEIPHVKYATLENRFNRFLEGVFTIQEFHEALLSALLEVLTGVK